MEWYTQIAADVAHPYISQLAEQLATLFFLGFIPGVVSLIFSGAQESSS